MITGSRKDKRPVVGPAVWQHQNRDVLNEAHFDFFELLLLFFFITLLPSLMRPYPPKQWRTINERRMNDRLSGRGSKAAGESWEPAALPFPHTMQV